MHVLCPPLSIEGDRAVVSKRICKVEVTIGQMWILRVKFTYRVVAAGARDGQTKDFEVACPLDEVKSTTYINGKTSSRVCHLDLDQDEFITGCEGLVHSHENLYTDLTFYTNKSRYEFRSARSSNTGVRQRSWQSGER